MVKNTRTGSTNVQVSSLLVQVILQQPICTSLPVETAENKWLGDTVAKMWQRSSKEL